MAIRAPDGANNSDQGAYYMGCDISGSNDNTIDQNLQGAKKNLLLKPLKQPWIYVASYHCGDFK